ncbi:MAG: hypothetical protein R2755_28110 [Acidimicrobiales bacterium]
MLYARSHSATAGVRACGRLSGLRAGGGELLRRSSLETVRGEIDGGVLGGRHHPEGQFDGLDALLGVDQRAALLLDGGEELILLERERFAPSLEDGISITPLCRWRVPESEVYSAWCILAMVTS